MRGFGDPFIDGLASLDRIASAEERRSTFRQSVAALAIAASGDAPAPLDTIDPAALVASVKIALADGLFDHLEFLAKPAAARALYEIAGALPMGAERRDLGRRVLSQLYEGDAGTFTALATRMAASGSARALSGSGIRARVALVLGLPATADVGDGPLALALATRRELAPAWVVELASGSLPERRLAARILEHAAREAWTRHVGGDDSAVAPFRRAFAAGPTDGDVLATAFRKLLADRESLVWRHVAAARGLLSSAVSDAASEIEAHLAPSQTPTEWRRAATSLVARIAVAPNPALARSIDLAKGALLDRDRGVATAMVWGAATAADAEPEAADEILDVIVERAALFVAETVAELRREAPAAGARAARACASAIDATLSDVREEDVSALAADVSRELRGEGWGSRPLAAAMRDAVEAFLESGPRDAHAKAERALEVATAIVRELEVVDVDEHGWPTSSAERAVVARNVRALDHEILETGALHDLLQLKLGPGDGPGGVAVVDDLGERLARWLTLIESVPNQLEAMPAHAAQHQRQLRALLHLIDGETTAGAADADRRTRVHDRWAAVARALTARLVRERPRAMRRAIAATVSRAFDALVRDDAADPADVLLYAARELGDAQDLDVLGEASMHPIVSELMAAYVKFTNADAVAQPDRALAALEQLVAGLPTGASQRIDGLRATLSRLTRGLDAVLTAESLRALGPDGAPLVAIEETVARVEQLVASAARRCAGGARERLAAGEGAYPLALALGRATQPGADPKAELAPSVEALLERARAELPPALANVLASILPHLTTMPIDASDAKGATLPPPSFATNLPAWLPSRRTIGGFFVQRQVGAGAGGTVFVVTRVEERHEAHAERFALKVPDYNATAARSVSEAEFLKLFRQEASALLSLPEHENLARFVTFDAGAKPKPILVMELVEGARLDQVIASRVLTMNAAIDLLDRVLAGLEAMHAVGVGHLDLKPSNVILRGGATEKPVLVDFGLSGKHIRPGCGTGSYGAPEVWGIAAAGARPTPLTADVYSFGCFAYETLTGATLFQAETEIAQIASHLMHDGLPALVKRLAQSHERLAMLLHACLRKSPEQRATVTTLRHELGRIAPELKRRSWPL